MHLWLPPEDPVSSYRNGVVDKSDEKQTDPHLEDPSPDVFEQITPGGSSSHSDLSPLWIPRLQPDCSCLEDALLLRKCADPGIISTVGLQLSSADGSVFPLND